MFPLVLRGSQVVLRLCVTSVMSRCMSECMSECQLVVTCVVAVFPHVPGGKEARGHFLLPYSPNETYPGGRYGSAMWIDNNDNLWLFGGQIDSSLKFSFE